MSICEYQPIDIRRQTQMLRIRTFGLKLDESKIVKLHQSDYMSSVFLYICLRPNEFNRFSSRPWPNNLWKNSVDCDFKI